MVSTVLVLTLAATSLALAWALLRSGHPEICSLKDWEKTKHDVDPQVFLSLLDHSEVRYLRRSLPKDEFRALQRKRIGLTWRMLRLVEDNAGMLIRLGHLARTKGDPRRKQQADELIVTAIQLRFNLLVVRLCLCLQWLFPSWGMSLPSYEVRYQQLLSVMTQLQLPST